MIEVGVVDAVSIALADPRASALTIPWACTVCERSGVVKLDDHVLVGVVLNEIRIQHEALWPQCPGEMLLTVLVAAIRLCR